MKLTSHIKECAELSNELKKILAAGGISTFADLAVLTRQNLITLIPKLKVRHLANLEQELERRKLKFGKDDSIKLDQFINQAKLCALWKEGVTTYAELDTLSYEEFVEALGGPQSRFFRNKAEAKKWMEKNGLKEKERHHLPHLSAQTAELLYKGNLSSLKEVAKKSDFELVRILQHNNKRAAPLTRARLVEIRYALYKEGIDRPCKPL